MNHTVSRWQSAMQQLPLIAILRGLQPSECIDVGHALIDAGFRIIEVPLNSPQPLETLGLLSETFGQRAIIGAGTVLTAEQATDVISTGCQLVIAPNLDLEVAAVVQQKSAIYCPGVMTPTEAFSAIAAGASALKLFPAEMIPPAIVKALTAVIPPDTMLLPVGGITPDNMTEYVAAGADGFGIGSALYKPGNSVDQISEAANEFVTRYRSI